jgi:hypothetical protein
MKTTKILQLSKKKSNYETLARNLQKRSRTPYNPDYQGLQIHQKRFFLEDGGEGGERWTQNFSIFSVPSEYWVLLLAHSALQMEPLILTNLKTKQAMYVERNNHVLSCQIVICGQPGSTKLFYLIA